MRQPTRHELLGLFDCFRRARLDAVEEPDIGKVNRRIGELAVDIVKTKEAINRGAPDPDGILPACARSFWVVFKGYREAAQAREPKEWGL